MDQPAKEYYTYQEVAEKFGVSDRTVWRWVVTGTIKARRFSRQIVRIPVAEIDGPPIETKLSREEQ
ncbi:excisionase/Xis, DNA-binding protein [Treponema primitia ZAS-2]|uniref:Excisionase/Xis, DNA-binding protein n=1 Tax=Treponema primitia (strain ATCC BAA-887 / DSM 12427 / ZAS-2) TaxID=545694 RepID=F5YQL4_TREPZ|nr:helix-turn-helix domain-containing protein [Treponema primitia]AEF87026.1 excisionase/Xis, DNA-binding protein [Treponema primitia ZAS-2]